MPFGVRWFRLLALMALGCVPFGDASCLERRVSERSSRLRPSEPKRSAPVLLAAPVPRDDDAKADDCERRWEAISNEPTLPGAPKLESVRGEVLARARAEPVLFLDAPRATPGTPRARELRARLWTEAAPWAAFSELHRRLSSSPEELRQVVLSDGYLYAETPALAVLLANALTLRQLFSEPELSVVRGDQTLVALRSGDEYVWADGPERGLRARLWLFDRVAARGQALGPGKHWAIGELGLELGTSFIEIERLTGAGVLARLHYGQASTRAVLRPSAGRLRLDCETIPEPLRAEVAARRAQSRRRARLLPELRRRIAEQVDEALPFDEPRTEEGQQDGKLRPEWRTAYLRGASSFEFNGDKYPVFDRLGRPRSPQVCVDFVVDTWERMAGTRWLRQSEGRGRSVGRIDFSALSIENQRSVEQLIEFARARPEWFDLLEVPEAERVPFASRRRFFERLLALRDEFRAGDVVAILGPRDDERLHYHSFFIVAEDPLSGMPTLLAANAGRPRLRSWEAELENAPRRGIVARIRPRLPWLESLTGASASSAQP
jgi:hypothetical protein